MYIIFIMYDLQIFNQVKNKGLEKYEKFDKILCPYLKKYVVFNRKGLEHISTKQWNRARLSSDQFLRYKFIHLAPIIISRSQTLQEYEEKMSFERVRINSRWEKRAVNTKYYGFVAILQTVRIKIVVKAIDDNEPYFWSIIPFWKQEKSPINGAVKRVFNNGDLEDQ